MHTSVDMLGQGADLKRKRWVGWVSRMDEGPILVDFAKRIKMAITNTFFQMRQKLWMTYKCQGTDDVI